MESEQKGVRSENQMYLHTRLMKMYKSVSTWWFLVLNIALILFACQHYNKSLRLPWRGDLLACVIAVFFTLPISIITATTNQVVGTIISVVVYTLMAWWLMKTIPNLCDTSELAANSPWSTSDRVFFESTVIWGLDSPRKIFRNLGGAVAPVLVYLAHKAFPKQWWILMIHMPVLSMMPPASSVVNYTMWVFLFLVLQNRNISLDWWGNQSEGCLLAGCPTTKGVKVDGCPVF